MPNPATLPPMNAPLRKPWSQNQFFAWASSQEERYEFDGFQPVAMTGGFNGSSAIGVNLLTALRTRLRGSSCRPLGPDAGVETINNAVRYPDALVTCTKVDLDDRTVHGVVIIFEVVGRSADANRRDRIVKVREYAAVSSIRRYVIVESSSVGLTVLERAAPDQTWQSNVLTDTDVLRMPEIGIEIPVAELYEDVEFTNQDNLEA